MKSLTGLIFICFVFSSALSFAQTNDIDFVLQKIELDYPGFQDKTNHNEFQLLAKKIISKNGQDTFRIISEIANLFGDQHLRIIGPNNWTIKDSLRCKENKLMITRYLNSKSTKNSYEGYWLSDHNDCVIGMKKEGDHFTAYVLEISGGSLLTGQIKGTFRQIHGNKYIADSYVTYSGKRVALPVEFRSDSIFIVGGSNKWSKIKNYKPFILADLKEPSDLVAGKLISPKTYLLTIPGSSPEHVVRLDSILKADYNTIKTTENLIVDVRYNGGGKSAIYNNLLPLVYTNPYLSITSYMYCTEDGARHQEELVESYKKQGMDTATLEAWAAYIKMMRDSIGKLVLRPATTVKFDSILAYPAHVGVIMNYATQSAAEMLVLMFMNSKKVTVFGEHSIGAVDYLSFYSMDCPSLKYQLYMPTTKRYIPPGMQPLDGKGISPHIKISGSESNWVEFVKKYYEGK